MHAGEISNLAQAQSLGEFLLDQDCLFVSGDSCLLGQGVKHRFKLPIANTDYLVSELQTQLRNHQGENDNTIAFGVLPFCKYEMAQFIIPEQVARWDKKVFSQWLNTQITEGSHTENPLKAVNYLQDRVHFEHTVQQAKELFDKALLDKIVLSKQVELEFEHAINRKHVLNQLLTQSQSGYHFAFPTESESVLMGVSPELLLRKEGETVTSNPLAGSIPRDPCSKVEAQHRAALFSSKKDRYEHAVVIDDMRQLLEPVCDNLAIPAEPSLLHTATMWHLSTVISGHLKDPSTHILALANQLHPTPALCGKPTKPAYQHILDLEGHGRDLFSGIIGWCDQQGNGEWVVVIRCGELKAHVAKLFAGAGIVAASDPSSEWLETEAKLKTMLNALSVQQAYTQFNK
ncbi:MULTISPECIES: isochorismate synthase [Pseudoalteromonas]|uniref:isochorismate synthase n=1 Tax=Pseudoalteromonas obscura TaxID=3048491 RepID=A0ABT7ESR4_9GAMM|nr:MULTISPECIES: isochorismate synthase [Pseudoalteromonas]MBQ4839265.1 isochorismate synthase [Pseudoalteromonas luteoviolacea]MDK2598106.1 isochorismate synthase [Pseudoalteromonas sp. P94(2023)]